MAVKFILGNVAEKRSEILYEKAIEASKNGNTKVFIVVPEQFTLETQKGILKRHPNHGILNIDVVSFNRFAYKVLSKIGWDNLPVIYDTGKSMLIRKAVKKYENELKFFSGRLRKRGFISEMKSIISENEQYNIKPEMLKELISEDSEFIKTKTALKINDIYYIYKGYREEISNRFISGEDLLSVFNRRLTEEGYLKDAVLLFDGFTGFTPSQYKLMETFIMQARDVYISVIYGDATTKPALSSADSGNLFFMSDDMMNKITDLSSRIGKNTEYEYVTAEDKGTCDRDIDYLKKTIFSNAPATARNGDSVRNEQSSVVITEAFNLKEEIYDAMLKIYDLTRNKGYRYKDIAIVTQDLENNGKIISKIMTRNGYTVFIDKKNVAFENAYIENIRSILVIAAKGYSYDNIFRFIKNGFSGVDMSYVNELENYCLALGIDGRKKWNSVWESKTKKDRKKEASAKGADGDTNFYDFKRLNELREQITGVINAFTAKLAKVGTTSDYIKVLREFLSGCDTSKANEETQKVIEKVDKLLEETEMLFGDEQTDTEEFIDILEAGFEEISVGFIPPSIDCITIGDVERTRLTNVKALFIIGVNDGIFPGVNSDSGVLTNSDRIKLNEKNIQLAPTVKEKAFIQKFYLYMLLTKPFDRLYLSYAKNNRDGESLSPSYFIKKIREILPGLTIDIIDEKRRNEFNGWVPKYSKVTWEPPEDIVLKKETVDILYGNKLFGSVSSFEKYASCPFSYFMNYSLGIDKREKYEFDPSDFGSAQHDIIEKALRLIKEKGLDPLDIDEKILKEISDTTVFNTLKESDILGENSRNRFLKEKIGRLSLRTIKTVNSQLASGKFMPEFFEKEMLFEKELSDGKILKFNGKIDRIDTTVTEGNNYIRIVDYKTGSKKFDLNEAYHGLQIQLVEYMNAAINTIYKDNGCNNIPAAMNYYLVKDPFIETENEKDLEKIDHEILKELKMIGPVNKDEKILSMIDSENSGIVCNGVGGRAIATKQLFSTDDFLALQKYADKKLETTGKDILSGRFPVFPAVKGNSFYAGSSCDYCNYVNVCNFQAGLSGKCNRIKSLSDEAVWEKIKTETEM